MVLRLRRWMWFCCWIASFTAFRFILLMCRDINRILWKKLLLLRINIARIDSSEVIRSASCPVIFETGCALLFTLGAKGYFFREIEREIRGGATSPRREAPRSKKYFAPPLMRLRRGSLSQSREKNNLWHPGYLLLCYRLKFRVAYFNSQWKQMSRVNVGV